MLLNGDVLSGDTIAVRRASEQLARRAKDLPSLEVYAKAAHAAYLALRGELSAGVALYEEILPEIGHSTCVGWATVRAFYADALNRAGQHARAKQLITDVLVADQPEEQVMVGRFLEPQRQLALAEAGLGNFAEATRSWTSARKTRRTGQSAILGLLHKARAEVALLMSDGAEFRRAPLRNGQTFSRHQEPGAHLAVGAAERKRCSSRACARLKPRTTPRMEKVTVIRQTSCERSGS